MSQTETKPQLAAERPSIFVLLAEDQLQSTLRGAINFVLKFLSDKYPSQFLKLYSSELSLLLDVAIQWSYLHRWNASFTERFFSLQRYNHNGTVLTPKDIFKSLVLVAVVPYLMQKLDRYWEAIQERQQLNEQFGQSLYQLTPAEKVIFQHYSLIKKLHQMLRIIFWISYSAGNHHGPSLPFWVLGNLWLGYGNELILQQQTCTSNWSYSLSDRLTKLFDVALKSGAFLVQFLEFWYSQADVRQMLSTVGQSAIPPPPPKSKNLSISPELCPLCLQKRLNQTALSTSGYVFCYICIHDYVKNNRKCPVTGFPCTLDQLIRIFD